MKRIISNIVLYILLALIQVFFVALIAPFNAINIISVYLALIFWASDFEKAFFAAMVLGVMSDFITHAPFLGIGSVEFALALFIIFILRTTIITNENRISLFFLSIVFNSVYYGIEIVRNFRFSTSILEETIFAIIINSMLAFAVYAIIRFFGHQINRRFM